MTYTDPGAPNGGRGNEEEEAVALPDDQAEGEPKSASGTTAETHAGGGHGGGPGTGPAAGAPDSDEFLGVEKDFWVRLLFVIAAGFVAWVSFWFIIILAVAQIIYRLAAGHSNQDLRGFTGNMIRYMRDLLRFITLVSDERPFLFGGKFPESRIDDL